MAHFIRLDVYFAGHGVLHRRSLPPKIQTPKYGLNSRKNGSRIQILEQVVVQIHYTQLRVPLKKGTYLFLIREFPARRFAIA